MKQILDAIEKYPVASGLIAPLVSLAFPQVRRALRRALRILTRAEAREKEREETLTARKAIMDKLGSIEASTATTGSRLEIVEKEMKFNDGRTIKDMLFLIFSYRRHDFWRLGRPAMEMDGDGQVTLVSEAMCLLFGVVTPDDLKRRSWLRYVDSDEVDGILRACLETVLRQSEFSYTMELRSHHGESRGQWELRGSPITPESAKTKIYSCFIDPACDRARAFAASMKWHF